jgi:hypothetical protein
MKKVLTFLLLLMGSIFIVTVNGLAMNVNFKDPYYAAADGLGSFHSAKHNLTLFAMPPSCPTCSPDPYLTWYADDGIGGGGSSYEEDEWEWNKWSGGDYLKIAFDTSVQLDEIHLTDFFYEKRQGHWYEETGGVAFRDKSGNWLGGSHVYSFSQTDHNVLPSPVSNGEYVIDVASLIGAESLVKDVYLAGIGYKWVDCVREDHEFAVAGLNVVPEPATILLLGSGLVGLAGFRRKFRKK